MRKITAGELSKILKEHDRWYDTEVEGEKADLSSADLRDADLSDADLRNADLSDADLSGTYLKEADLSGTDLRGANLAQALLSIHLLSSVETLYEAELDPELMDQVEYEYPHLLEKPEYYKEEIESCKQAIRLDPDNAEAHFNLGIAYLCLEDNGSALEQYKILKKLDTERANRLFNLINK
jgi:tetratricopeptide (TPR) repeat protein